MPHYTAPAAAKFCTKRWTEVLRGIIHWLALRSSFNPADGPGSLHHYPRIIHRGCDILLTAVAKLVEFLRVPWPTASKALRTRFPGGIGLNPKDVRWISLRGARQGPLPLCTTQPAPSSQNGSNNDRRYAKNSRAARDRKKVQHTQACRCFNKAT